MRYKIRPKIPNSITELVDSLEYDKQKCLYLIGDNLYYNLNTIQFGDGLII